jgi:hypothetical protein
MKIPELALRYRGGDRHHLFNNNGTWFVRYSIREAAWLKADRRVVASLATKNVTTAQQRRDAFFSQLKLHVGLRAAPQLLWREGRAA